ncbi:cupin domain-containing protein [Streptomyces griseorubiginosus]|uniref:cupin domain-containing protein n=1 Tax=Streptomyces griseorubiginosus TaxID=67304 RepID=UPI0011401920|nr:cupin domain-containing protein [Streptomyces griseorubiginosus]
MTEATRPAGEVRRVVTAINDRGRSYVLQDGPAPNRTPPLPVPGLGGSHAWATEGPVVNTGTEDLGAAGLVLPSFPKEGGTVFRVVDFPPDTAYTESAAAGMYASMGDGGDEAREQAEHSGRRHFWFHRTDTLDYAIVLGGEIVMLLDEEECLLKAGDIVVQRGTAHAWSNRSDSVCRIAFVLVGAEPVPADAVPADAMGHVR